MCITLDLAYSENVHVKCHHRLTSFLRHEGLQSVFRMDFAEGFLWSAGPTCCFAAFFGRLPSFRACLLTVDFALAFSFASRDRCSLLVLWLALGQLLTWLLAPDIRPLRSSIGSEASPCGYCCHSLSSILRLSSLSAAHSNMDYKFIDGIKKFS